MRWTLPRRPEAVYASGVGADELDAGLADVVAELTSLGMHIALDGLADAASAAKLRSGGETDRLLVADADHASFPAGRGGTPPWAAGTTRFVDWWFQHVWRLGIGPGLVVVLAPPTGSAAAPTEAMRIERSTPSDLIDLLEELRADRQDGALPDIDQSPGWTLTLPDDRSVAADVEASLFALSSGTIGVRGDQEDRSDVDHFVSVNGAYGEASDGLVRPLPGPAATVLVGPAPVVPARGRPTLDLRTGVLVRTPAEDGLRSVRFVSLARPGLVAIRAEDHRTDVPWTEPLAPPEVRSGAVAEHGWVERDGDARALATTTSDRAAVDAAAQQRCWTLPGRRRVERTTCVTGGPPSIVGAAGAMLTDVATTSFDELLADHRRAWVDRWEAADIEIDGDPAAQLAIRVALFHLLSCAPVDGEGAVGARGLTGLAYAGHVFWDTDVFVLPALAATLPDAARSVLAYRAARLPAARSLAAENRRPGARYPWESADSGADVTPSATRDLDGQLVPIRTGEHAEHINADVAWAFRQYLDWTGDEGLLDGQWRDVVVETARYWQARARVDDAGRGHLLGVMGPDEYHEVVDDNAFTNGMARWHLRWAAELLADRGGERDASSFEAMAACLVDGFDPTTARHEQFAGFWELEPLMIEEVAAVPVAADLLLGRERTARTQVIKQPDVLMLHHLVPGGCPPGSLDADLRYYLPRTAHGSSLSPAICASLLARSGSPDEAMRLFDIAARIDLDDLTSTSAGGLHLATMGGLWQAVVHGFAGIRPSDAGLVVDPRLPARWTRLSVRIRFRGTPVVVTVDHHAIRVDSCDPVPLVVRGRPVVGPAEVRVAEQEQTP